MPDRHVDVLLIGAGTASAAAARALREEGFGGSVLLAGREPDPPYERPPLTKSYLAGASSREDALLAAPGWWAEHDVTLATRTSVTALDAAAREATLSTREVVSYERALLATGAMVRRLPLAGAQLAGVHYVRALANADAIRADLEGGGSVVCVGGSYIALETAATLTSLGHEVTVVMLEEEPFQRSFGVETGRWFRRLFEERGVRFVASAELMAFEGPEGEDARVEAVRTAAGERIAARTVIVGAGVAPDVTLARRAGLSIGGLGGVLCDAGLRTSAPGLWAAGDVCEYQSVVHGRPVRVEHHEAALAQGAHAGRAMAGADTGDFAVVPLFFSDLSDWASLEYVGPAVQWDREVVRVGEDGEGFGVWYLEEGRVRAALSVGGALDLGVAGDLLRSGRAVGAEALP
jgi:3-phenylpropionate/trans-cinnamate dioxygenase ferredoxin reductase subunit